MTSAASGTRKNSKAVAVGLSISNWTRSPERSAKGGGAPVELSFTRRATRQWQFTIWSSLDVTRQSVDPRPNVGSQCLEREDCRNRYESRSNGILRQLKPGFVFPECSEHDLFLPRKKLKA